MPRWWFHWSDLVRLYPRWRASPRCANTAYARAYDLICYLVRACPPAERIVPLKRRYQVFVSSTFADLIDERQKVLHTLVELGCFPAGMEFFPAASRDAWSHIASIIDDSDYYVIVIGGRYGSLTSEGVSFTEAEYNYAVERKPVLAFLHRDPDSLSVRRSDLSPEARASLSAFRGLLEARHTCRYWESPDELAGSVAKSLAPAFESDPAPGWIRADGTGDDQLVRRATGFDVVKHSEMLRLNASGFDALLNITIRASNPGLEVFYRQTGGIGNTRFVDAEALTPSATLLRPILDVGDQRRYFVHLGRQLVTGEETLVQLRETFVEERRDSHNLTGYLVNHGVEELELLVEYPATRVPLTAHWREYVSDPDRGDVLDGGDLPVSPSGGVLEFRRSKPTIGNCYTVEWVEGAP